MKIQFLAPLKLACVALFLLTGLSANAQFRASIQGTVTDPDGAVIPGAQLTLKDNGTNRTVTAVSDGSGVYNFNALPADDFTLTATAKGFQQKEIDHLQIIPEQANSVNVQLTLGEASTSITVSGDTTSAVDTETANIGATVSTNDIQHLPSFNRDVFTLSQLVPGAISDGSQAAGGGVHNLPGEQGPGGSGNGGNPPTENGPQIQSNGGQYETNGISIDGISTVSAVWGGTTIITPTEESIDNVRILTNNYDAEYGRFSGAQTLVTSKSGTNQFHGSAFISIHRPGLNAYQPAVRDNNGNRIGSPLRDTARFNQYGGSIGGPIIKNRLFAFFAYEASPLNSNTTSNGWYETSQFRSSSHAGPVATAYIGFPGSAPLGTIVTTGETCTVVGLVEGTNCRTIAGQGLDIGSPLTTGVGKQDTTSDGTANNPGVGSGLDGVADVAYYTTSTPTSQKYTQYNGRMDYQATQKDRVSFAIYWVPFNSVFYNGGARSYNLFNHDQINEALSGIWNHTFSGNLLNEARANAAGWRYNELASNPQQPIGLAQDNVTFAPGVSNNTLNQFGTSIGGDLNQWTFTYKDVLTKIAGRHSVKVGAEYTGLHYLKADTGRPTFNFYGLWDFLNDAPYYEQGGFNSVTGLPDFNRSDERENLFGAFVQDDFKIAPSLTLHAGLRYSYFGTLYAKQGNLPSAQFGAGSAAYTGMTVATNRNVWNPQKLNFGPQIGFNWAPSNLNQKLVIRGGYGLNFNEDEIAITANTAFNPPAVHYIGYKFASPTNPGTDGSKIVYGISTDVHSITGFPANPNTITTYNANGIPTAGSANAILLGSGTGNLPTMYVHHFSLDTEYQINSQLVASIGYQGALGHHLINHQTPNAPGVVLGQTLNPLITSGDYWTNEGSSNNNALLLELKHPEVHHLSLDAQFQWAKSLDTDGSGPYYEDPYFPLNSAYSYGPSDFNVGKSFKVFGLWQPVFFHSNGPLEKVVGGWSLSGIFQWHTGFPYSPTYPLPSSLYCTQCGYYNIRPSYSGAGGHDHSNRAFINDSNFPNISSTAHTTTATVNGNSGTAVQYSNTYFVTPNFYSAIQQSGSGFPSPNLSLPPLPGLDRNAFVGPSYRNLDASLAKSFGIPNNRVLGEHAGIEIRADAFNLFNILNLDPGRVNTNVNSPSFSQDTTALGGRTVSLTARFSF